MKITYFAWIAEQLGRDEELFAYPSTGTINMKQLVSSLNGQYNGKVFGDFNKIYVALNGVLVRKDKMEDVHIEPNDTVSFFPAISGG